MFNNKPKTTPCPICGYENPNTEIYCGACKTSLLRAYRAEERENKYKMRQSSILNSVSLLKRKISFILLMIIFYFFHQSFIFLSLFISYLYYPVALKWIALFWLFLCVTAKNRTSYVEIFSIIHSLIVFHIVFSLFIGSFELIGRWHVIGISSTLNNTEVLGWLFWATSIIFGIFFVRDHEHRFDLYYDNSIFATNTQIIYVTAFFGIYLIAYSDGNYKIPMYMTFFLLYLAISSLD